MWTPEDFPGADNVPWQLLIRARFVRDVDAFVATAIVRQVSQVASFEVATRVAEAAAEGMKGAAAEKVSRTGRADALGAVADFIDICPPWPWPWPWPWPGPWPWLEGRENPWEKFGSPYQGTVLTGALDLLRKVGSPQLQERMGGLLEELTQR